MGGNDGFKCALVARIEQFIWKESVRAQGYHAEHVDKIELISSDILKVCRRRNTFAASFPLCLLKQLIAAKAKHCGKRVLDMPECWLFSCITCDRGQASKFTPALFF